MLLSSINNKRNNHRYSIQQESKRKKDFRKSRNKQQLNKNKININNDLASKSSRSSSLHSLVSTTTFLNRKSIWKLNKMIATTTSPNSNQFNNHHHHHNSNKTFNSFKNNNNNSSSISSNRRSNEFNKKNANINNRFQQKKSNPIQINRNNFAQQQQQQPNFNLNMFQNSELTVNLTNNEPRLVIFNNNPSSQSFNLPNNSNKLINYFNNNKFKPQSQQQQQHHQFQRQLSNSATTTSANLEASNCFKQNITPTTVGTQQQQQQQRYSSNRFKYIKSISHSATKNSAPYNTTQYIMFDYSRRRRDEEYPNEQKSFSDEWNMHLAAANKETNNNPIEINDNNASIISVNYNHFSLNNSSKQDNKPEHLGNRQLSLSEHNLENMDQDEVEQMQVVNTLNETLPSPSITTNTIHHMSSSL